MQQFAQGADPQQPVDEEMPTEVSQNSGVVSYLTECFISIELNDKLI